MPLVAAEQAGEKTTKGFSPNPKENMLSEGKGREAKVDLEAINNEKISRASNI